MEIFYACNSQYITQTLVSAETLFRSNPEAHVTIAGDQFTHAEKGKICRQFRAWKKDVRLVDFNDFFPASILTTDAYHARSIYAKLFIDRIYEGGRVLYLDSDTVICGRLDALFAMNLENNTAAAVKMPYPQKFRKSMGLPENIPYYCDGVVLFDVDRWKTEDGSNKSFQIIQQYQGNPPGQSEGVLNHVLSGKIRTLPPRYNLMSGMIYYPADKLAKLYGSTDYYCEKDRRRALRHPMIIHYIRELYNRPWQKPCGHPYRKIYWKANSALIEPGIRSMKIISIHTIITRLLYRTLPFSIFCSAFQYKHCWRKQD